MIYFIPYLQMAIGGLGIFWGGAFTWTGFILLFLILPLIEFFLRKISLNPMDHRSRVSEAALLMTPLALSALLAVGLWRATLAQNGFELMGLILSLGTMLGAYGITSAHELVHRRNQGLRALGVYNLMLVNFAHWGIEHVFGHHKTAATAADPATARRDESIYPYWIRSYVGVYLDAWKIAPSKVAFYAVVTGVATLGLGFIWDGKVLAVWLLSSLVAILLLQTVDYIEHYGLLRPKNADGFDMAFKAWHSWDTSSLWTNATLFNLGLHSHHHMKANLDFQQLEAQTAARKMPFGYSIMVPLALLPWVYRPMMNRLLDDGNN